MSLMEKSVNVILAMMTVTFCSIQKIMTKSRTTPGTVLTIELKLIIVLMNHVFTKRI